MQRLGDRQPPGAAGVGGIHDHRNAGGHRLLNALVQPLLDVHPRALNGGIAEHVGPNGIGGEHLRRRFTRGGEQGCQGLGQGGLAAGGLADQQVAAQRRHRDRAERPPLFRTNNQPQPRLH